MKILKKDPSKRTDTKKMDLKSGFGMDTKPSDIELVGEYMKNIDYFKKLIEDGNQNLCEQCYKKLTLESFY